MTPPHQPVSPGSGRVLFMAARPRSGTTILGNALGELPGWFHAGELRYLWTEGLPKPRRDCGCRRPVSECPTWQAVAASMGADVGRAPADADHATIAGALGLPGASSMTRWQTQPMGAARLLVEGRERLRRGPLKAYVEHLDDVYEAILTATDSRVIVDTSKSPQEALLVALLSRHAPEVLHVTRDPRGAVLSRLKWYADERPDGTYQLAAGRLVYEGIQWCGGELMGELLFRRHGVARGELKYEDFVRDPESVIRRIAAMMGDGDVDLPFLQDSVITLATNHTVSGNRNRWQVGEVPIAADESWRQRMRSRDRALATFATSPGLARYGYWSRSGRRPG